MVKGKIRCILFDLGSTLWERKDRATLLKSEQAANAIALSTLRRLPHTKKVLAHTEDEPGSLLREMVEKRLREKARQNREYEPDFALVAMEALHELGMKHADRQAGEAIFEALRVRTPDARILFDDTHATLAALKERGYILGIVTNRHYGGQPFYEDLEQMGLLDYIDYATMAISADLGVRKPHSDIFMHALRALNVAPQEAAMVGDSLRADIAGAKRLHMRAIWKPKASVRAKARAAFHSASQAQPAHEPSHKHKKKAAQATSNPGRDVQDLPDEYILSYVLQHEEHLSPSLRNEMTPDAIIKDLSELLTLFP